MQNSRFEYSEIGHNSEIDTQNLDKLVTNVVQLLKDKDLHIAIAESLTGGLISELVTSVPGASKVFGLGVVTYSDDAKKRFLNVSQNVLEDHGAVSPECAADMSRGLCMLTGADICVSATGYAGAGSSQVMPEKVATIDTNGIPVFVGTVYIGVSHHLGNLTSSHETPKPGIVTTKVKKLKLYEFKDRSRSGIRRNTAICLFNEILDILSEHTIKEAMVIRNPKREISEEFTAEEGSAAI